MTSPQHEPTIREVLDSIENLGKPRKPSPLETAIIVALGITSSVYLWILGISGINRPALYLLGLLIILGISYWMVARKKRVRRSRFQDSLLRKPRWWFWLIPLTPWIVFDVRIFTEDSEGLISLLAKGTIILFSILWGLVFSMTLLIEARHPDEQSRMLSSTTDRPRHG